MCNTVQVVEWEVVEWECQHTPARWSLRSSREKEAFADHRPRLSLEAASSTATLSGATFSRSVQRPW